MTFTSTFCLTRQMHRFKLGVGFVGRHRGASGNRSLPGRERRIA